MSKKCIKYTDIGQFRSTIHSIKKIYAEEKELPVLEFEGTVKLHGTNAGISYNQEKGLWVQSRTNVIEVGKDNAGFAFYVESHKQYFEELLKTLLSAVDEEKYTVSLYGEWCGGGIQKGVALNQLDKRFVTFALKYTNIEDPLDHWYIKPDCKNPEISFFNIYDYKTFNLSIDFNRPEKAQAQMIEWVDGVEKLCPFGKAFNVDGVGEGIVFSHYEEGGIRKYIFKAKGQKHTTSKVKTLASVDIEKVDSIIEFVEYAVTENRLNQGIEQVFTSNSQEISIKGTGAFIKWMMSDIIKEELDVMIGNNLEPSDIGSAVGNKSRKWFMDYLTSTT